MREIMDSKILIFSVLAALFMISGVSAFSLGVSPATLDYEIAPGYSMEKTLTVSTNSENSVKVSIAAESELKEWISFDMPSDTAKKDAPLKVAVKIKVPGSAAEKSYEDVITVTASASEGTGEGAESKIAPAVAVKTSLNVSKEAKPEGMVKEGISTTAIVIIAVIIAIVLAIILLKRKKRRPF